MDKAKIVARKAEILAEYRNIIGGRIESNDYLEAWILGNYNALGLDPLVKLVKEYRQLHDAEQALAGA